MSLHQTSQFNRALPIFIKLTEKFRHYNDVSNYALCQLKIADIIRNYGGVNTSIELVTNSEKMMEVRLERPSILWSQAHLTKAEASYSLSRLKEFKAAVHESIKVKKYLKLAERELAEDYLQLGRYYIEFQNQRDSCYYWASKALNLANSDKQKYIYLLPRIYNLLGYYYHPASIAYFRNNLYQFKSRLIISRKYYDSALQIVGKQKVVDALMKGKIYHNLGNSYSNEHGLATNRAIMTAALNYYKSSQSAYEKFGSPAELSLKDWVIAKAYERLAHNDSAIYQLHLGVSRLVPAFKSTDVTTLPELQPSLDDARLLTLVSLKGNNFLFRYKRDKKIGDLKTAYEHFSFLLKFNQYIIHKSSDEQSTTYINHMHGSNAYQQLMAVAFELSKLTNNNSFVGDVYSLIASGKYVWLSRNDIKPSLRQTIQASVLREESIIITRNILKLSKEITADQIASLLPQPIKTEPLRNQDLFRMASNATDGFSLSQIKAHLKDENETLIDYYKWGNELFVTVVSPDQFNVSRILLVRSFDSEVRNLKRSLVMQRPTEYAKNANSIYRALLDSIINTLPNKTSKLIICPDGNLQDVPWDALVRDTTKSVTFKDLDYLLKHRVIRTTLTPKQLIQQGKKQEGYVGVVSDFKDSRKFSEIPFSAEVVRQKVTKMGGALLTSLPESKTSARILHVTAHVVGDSLRPYRTTMYFSDRDSVAVGDLTQAEVAVNLVILNGCQTGKGTYYQSEGTISFARAFYNNLGAQSVLMTLWNVDDKTTSEVIDNFYTYLFEGERLDVSLNKAKIKFIDNASADELANPYYWAGLQLSGNPDPAFNNSNSRIIISALAGFFSFVGMLYFVKRKRASIQLA